MSLFQLFKRKPNTETLQKKAAVDRAYAKFMSEIRGFTDYWRDIFEPEYKASPLKIENKVD